MDYGNVGIQRTPKTTRGRAQRMIFRLKRSFIFFARGTAVETYQFYFDFINNTLKIKDKK
jgi:hypothetical protein